MRFLGAAIHWRDDWPRFFESKRRIATQKWKQRSALSERLWCSREMRECSSEKCAGWWVVSIQRCLWLCRGKVAARHSPCERARTPLRGARRVEDLGSSAFRPAARHVLSAANETHRPRTSSSTLEHPDEGIRARGIPRPPLPSASCLLLLLFFVRSQGSCSPLNSAQRMQNRTGQSNTEQSNV